MADPVNFTRPAAERISRVVRSVEFGSRDSFGAGIDRPWYSDGPAPRLHLATFTGGWSTSTYKTVTLLGSTATASVYNWCNQSASNTSCSGYVIFSKVNGTNSVLELTLQQTCGTCVTSLAGVDLTQVPGYSAGAIQLLGHSAADLSTNNTACASLTWYSITTCSTAA